MTDLAKLSDQEINRRVAEAMGLDLFEVRGHIAEHRADGTDAPVPDFLHDWQAFGRLRDHTKQTGYKLSISPNMVNTTLTLTLWDPESSRHGQVTDSSIRRALALAFLEAVDQ